jgi:hypothetical protein
MTARLPTSVILQELLYDASAEVVTLGWLVDRLGDRSFGIVLILSALLGLLPGVSAFAGVLLMVPAFQMMMARPGPVFPPRVGLPAFQDAAASARHPSDCPRATQSDRRSS